MTPELITNAGWDSIFVLLTSLWLIALFTVAFALSFLLGHAILPSLISTGHLPARAQGLRALFYLISLLALAVDVAVIYRLGAQAGVIQAIYPRFLL